MLANSTVAMEGVYQECGLAMEKMIVGTIPMKIQTIAVNINNFIYALHIKQNIKNTDLLGCDEKFSA